MLASSRTGIEHLALQLGLPKLPDPKPAQPRASLATTRPLSPHSPQSPTAHAAPAEHADADVSVAVLAVCEEKEAALLAAIADAAARPAPGKAPPPAAPAKGAASILSRAPRAQSLTKEPSMDRTAHAAAEPAPRISNRALMSRERGLDQWPATSEADAAAHHVERVDERDAASTRRESEWRPEDGGGAAGEEGWREGLHVRVVEPGKGGGKKAKGGRKDAMSAMAKVLQMQTVRRAPLQRGLLPRSCAHQ